MNELRFEAMHLRKKSDVVYVKDAHTGLMLTKFEVTIQKAEEVAGWNTLTPGQQLEIKNYIANLRFITDKLNANVKINRAYRFSLPEPFQQALLELSVLAHAHEIAFDPMTAMLNALLHHVRTTEKRINQLTQSEANILPKLGILLEDPHKVAQEKETKKYSKKIFKRLLLVPNFLEKYAAHAKTLYQKDTTNLNRTAVMRYAEGNAKPSLWSISCALTVLGQEKMVISESVPLNEWLPLWLTPLKFSGQFTDTAQVDALFRELFSEERQNMDLVKALIDTLMNTVS